MRADLSFGDIYLPAHSSFRAGGLQTTLPLPDSASLHTETCWLEYLLLSPPQAVGWPHQSSHTGDHTPNQSPQFLLL